MGRLRNFVFLLSMVTFYFSTKSVACMVIFWLSVANSSLSSAKVNLCCPPRQEWFLMHGWPTALLIWGCAADDTGSSLQTPGFQHEKRSRWPFLLFSAVFFLSYLSWAGNSYQQGALLACLQLSLHAGTLLLELSSTSAWCSSPWWAVSFLLPFSLHDFRAIKPWTWSNSRIPPQMQHLQEPTQVQLCYPAFWFMALFLASTSPSASHGAIATFHAPRAYLCPVQKYGKFASFIPSCFVYTLSL